MNENNKDEHKIIANHLTELITDFEKGKLLPLISLLEKKNIITREELLEETVRLDKEMEKQILDELNQAKQKKK